MTTRTTLRTVLLGIALGMIFIPVLSGVAPAQAKPQQGTFVTFDIPGGANELIPNFITPAGVVTGSYLIVVNNNFVSFGFLRQADGSVITISVPGSTSTSVGPAEGVVFAGPPINPAGAITGSYSDISGATHGYVRAPDGMFTTFDAPGAVNGTFSICITPTGAVVGASFDANFVGHGFLRAPDGTFTPFDPPGSTETLPTSINPAGAITGEFFDANGTNHGFLRARDGTITTFDAPGAVNGTTPNDINPAGAITGYFGDANGDHGFLRAPDGTITTFDVSGFFLGALANSINPAGAIAGDYFDETGFHVFIRAPDGTFTTADPPGSTATEGGIINHAGAVTGFYYDTSNAEHGFIFFPH
jgi:hypothetical protein